MKIRHALEIEAPIERLWTLTIDIEGWPAITPTVTSVQRLDSGPLRVGSRARLKQPGQSARVWTVTALDPPHRFAWSTRLLGVTMTGVHELTATDVGTRNVLSLELTGWASSLVGLALRIPMARAIATENEAFKAAVRRDRDR